MMRTNDSPVDAWIEGVTLARKYAGALGKGHGVPTIGLPPAGLDKFPADWLRGLIAGLTADLEARQRAAADAASLDASGLDAIATVLGRSPDWDADVINQVADLLRATGRRLPGDD